MDDDNIFRLGAIPGGKGDKDDSIPENDYIVVDIDDEQYAATGFLVFTPHHLAIMRDAKKGVVPVLVLPIARVKSAEIFEEDEEEDDLFDA